MFAVGIVISSDVYVVVVVEALSLDIVVVVARI